MNYTHEKALFVRAMIKKYTEDFEGAINDFNKVLNINPNNDNASFQRGLSKLAMENLDGCMNDLENTIKINTKNKDAFYFKGLLELARKNKEAGYTYIKKASELGSVNALKWLKRTEK